MFWKIIGTIGAGTFILGGIDILSTTGCDSVDFGGAGRSSTYTCTYGEYPGEMSASTAGGLMVVGGLIVICLLWASVFSKSKRGY
jgi:hypothetical protein